MRFTIFILVVAFISILPSCDRLKREGHEIADKTEENLSEAKQKIKNKKDQLIDKAFSSFDSGKPDTESNKKRFKEFFGFYPTADVKNIYTHSDELGIDDSYYFAFECADTTITRIEKSLILSIDTTGTSFSGGLNTSPTFWWDTMAIRKIKPFSKQKENLYWYLWHDKRKHKAYFMTFNI